jgi:hypothetical protein
MSKLLDGFWKYSLSDSSAPILDVPKNITKSVEFTRLVQLKLVQSTMERHIVCPGCFQHSEDVEAVAMPDGSKKFYVFCPQAGTEEVTPDEMRQWHIHFSDLPGIMAAKLGMRDPQPIVRDTLWKLGGYGDSGDIWFGRWLNWRPEADEWLRFMPRTPQTILLYIGQPPDLCLFDGMPQTNIIDVSRIVTVGDDGLQVDMRLVDAALRRGTAEYLAANACVFRKNGDHWNLAFAGKSITHRHLKGMLYIQYLLEIAPNQVPIIQLRRVSDPGFQPKILGDAGEVLDEQALKQFHERLALIDTELDEAKDQQDFGRQSDLVDEQEFLKEQLRAAIGSGGRKRKAGDDRERNRKAVCNAIDNAIKSITAEHRAMGEHLDVHISRGTHCFYRLESGMVWST